MIPEVLDLAGIAREYWRTRDTALVAVGFVASIYLWLNVGRIPANLALFSGLYLAAVDVILRARTELRGTVT